jgi:hypothetical protein
VRRAWSLHAGGGHSADCGVGGVTGLAGVFGVCGESAVLAVGAVPAVSAVGAVLAVGAVSAVTVVIAEPFWTSAGPGVDDEAGLDVGALEVGVAPSTWTDGERSVRSGASNTPWAVATVAPRPTAPSAPVTIHTLRAFMMLLLRPVVRTAPRPPA